MEEVAIFNMKGRESRIVKVKASLDFTRVLKDKLKIAGPNKKVIALALKYERIGFFCHYCYHLGYEGRACSKLLEDSVKGELRENKIGPWL